jgi:hypothetical protein
MVEGPVDDADADEGNPEDGRILSPEELDITESEYVEELDEGRFVVSPEARVPSDNTQSETNRATQQQSDPDPEPEQQSEPEPEPRSKRSQRQPPAKEQREDLSQEVVHRWLRQSFEESSSRYAFDVTATFDNSVSQRRMASNDVVTIFESLMLWYAQQVDNDTPVEEIIGILLMESNVPIRLPPKSLHKLIKSSGLGPDDTIADLVNAVKDEDGFKL